jgi:hypothetical protein
MLIEVKELHDPKPGGKVAHIVTADGERYQIWPDKLNGATVGKRYDAEIDTHDYGGRTFKKITKLTPLREEPTPPMSEKFPTLAASPVGEVEYVGRVLAALIIKGEVTVNQVPAYTMRLREVWRQSDHRSPAPKHPGDCNDR